MRTFFYLFFVAVIVVAVKFIWNEPSTFSVPHKGKLIDRFRLYEGDRNGSHTYMIFMMRYSSGVQREIVDDDTYYGYKVGDKITLYKSVDNSKNTCGVLVIIGCIVILFFMIISHPEKKAKPIFVKAKHPFKSDWSDED